MVDPVDPALRRLADALGVAGVRWAVLRGEVGAPDDGDLDLLVHPDDVAAFARVARASGFPHLPAWGHAHHRFHLGRGRGGWWRLDVVDRFRFGEESGWTRRSLPSSWIGGWGFRCHGSRRTTRPGPWSCTCCWIDGRDRTAIGPG